MFLLKIFFQPKTRPTMLPSRYASLLSANPQRVFESSDGAGAFIPRSKIIGIGISAIHDSVLRAGVRMPGEFFIFSLFENWR